MKNFLLILVAIFTVSGSYAHDEHLEQKWDSANTMYINGNYKGAIAIYDSIATSGAASDKLYYNLGNAYFKENQIGKAILNYNRALKYSPSDKDTHHNLMVAGSYVKDKIEAVPEFFAVEWMRALRGCFSSNTWAIVSLVLLVVTCGLVLLYLLSKNYGMRKIGFFGAVITLLFAIYAISASSFEKREIVDPSYAIIMNSAVPVKSSPSKASTDIFVLHEGTRVKVMNRLQEWCEITIVDGNKGWVLASSIEMI